MRFAACTAIVAWSAHPGRRGRRSPAAGPAARPPSARRSRRSASFGREQRGQADDDADQQAGDHRARQRAHAADHGHDESLGQERHAHLGDDALAAARPACPTARRSPVPMPNTISQTCETSTPSTRTISGSRAPARMIRPKRVFSRNSHSADDDHRRRADQEQAVEREIADAEIRPRRVSACGVANGMPSMPKTMRTTSTMM